MSSEAEDATDIPLSSDPLVRLRRLKDCVQSEGKLYLVFEFLDRDLKKYMDSVSSMLDPMLVKVSYAKVHISGLLGSSRAVLPVPDAARPSFLPCSGGHAQVGL